MEEDELTCRVNEQVRRKEEVLRGQREDRDRMNLMLNFGFVHGYLEVCSG